MEFLIKNFMKKEPIRIEMKKVHGPNQWLLR